GWDDAKQETFHQRMKEGSADYRYFPEPDLPKLFISDIPGFADEVLRASLPELPNARRARYQALGVRSKHADVLLQNEFLSGLFEGVLRRTNEDRELAALAGNYLVSDLMGLLQKGKTGSRITADAFVELMRMAKDGTLSSRGTKDVLAHLHEAGGI